MKLIRISDGEVFSEDKNGLYSLDSSRMHRPYKWTRNCLLQTGAFSESMNLAETRTHEPLVNKPKVKKPKKAMPKVTKKRGQLNRQYMKLRAEYLRCHPYCEYFAHFKEIRAATEIHHRKGRGSFLLDTSTWMAVCTQGHQEIHFNTAESYRMGWMLPRR